MTLLLALAASAAEPVLGPLGWTVLGPVPPGSDRGAVVFDEACEVEVEVVDLDGGPGHADVRLARIWTGGAWAWADDWRVEGGRLLRPGRAPAPLHGDRFGEERLAVDAAGRVISRSRAGRRVEVLRDPDGAFVGMRRGPVSVRIDGDRGVAGDGREVRWRREAGELRSVADAGGVRALYGYAAGRLVRVDWADGTAIQVERTGGPGVPGAAVATRGVGGAWTCEIRSEGKLGIASPAGSWLVARDADETRVTDPTGATTRARSVGGRLAGWTDPRGAEVRLDRDDRGRLVAATEPSGSTWRFGWDDAGLLAVEAPDGGRWGLGRGPGGAVATVTEPTGRSSRWTWDASGNVTEVRIGGAGWAIVRDAAGRATRLVDPVGSAVELARGPDGRVVRVRDGGGGEWRVARDGRGEVAAVTAPGGGVWSVRRDGLGRPVAVTDPTGATTSWGLRDDGLPTRLVVGAGHVWELLWSGAGALTGLRDPLGRTTGWSRDALGRAVAVHRADGETVALSRDPAGDVVGVGDRVRIRRDGLGRPLGIDAVGLAWDRDAAGRVVGVTAPGVSLGVAREPGGAIREVRVGEAPPVELTRDGAGRVVRAEDADAVAIVRDAAGRVVALDGPAGRLALARDARGLVARIEHRGRAWTYGRDADGRVLSVEASGGARLGVDRDPAGLPRFVRFPGGELARFARDGDEVAIAVTDRDGRPLGELAWTVDAAGALARLRSLHAWVLRRDPLGALVVAERHDDAWSSAPDGVDGPGGAAIRYDARGRPVRVLRPEGAWGLGGELVYELDAAGTIVGIGGARGRVALRYDGAGRLTGWEGPDGGGAIVRDALGRLVRVGAESVAGWSGLLARGGVVRVELGGLARADASGGTLLGPDGAPLLTVPGGPVAWAPSGSTAGEAANGGRTALSASLPALGLLDAIDPASGQPLAAPIAWPWAARAWEPGPADAPFAEPDAAATVGWDDAAWAPGSPWRDPLAILVAAGELPAGGTRAQRPPGLPWLPASFAPIFPSPLPDPLAPYVEDEPLVAWIVANARAPVRAPDPHEPAAILLSAALGDRLALPVGLAPALPPELAGAP